MTYAAFFTFFFAALVLAVVPGPGMAYVVARTVAGGKREGLSSCLGTGVGGMVHVVAAALGLSVILMQSGLAFTVVKYVGAAYLVYLGIRILMRKPTQESVAVTPQGARRAFNEGIVIEALNVKTALFFLAFLPQFVNSDAAVLPQVLLLGTVSVLLNTLADVVAVLLAGRLMHSESGRAARARLLKRLSGSTMVLLGVYLALARRQA